MNIAVIGYPYVRPNYRATLEREDVFFVLPKVWKIKKGKSEYKTSPAKNIITGNAYFHHSGYPIIGGLLKGWMPLMPWYLWKLKRQHNIRLVFEAHEPNLFTTLYNGLAARLLGLKHVVFSWQNVKLLHVPLIMLNLMLSDGVVCGNKKCEMLFRPLTKKPILVAPLAGLDPDAWQAQPRPPKETVTFLFAGAIDYRKGIHILQEAIKKVPHAKLILVGSGSYEKNITHPITPWANHEQLKKYYQEADVFVYPSIAYKGWEEQFGYSMAEASLMELPVVATRTGSIDEVVEDGTTGILVAPEDVEALSVAMTRLAEDLELRHRMGAAGREFIATHFSHQAIAEKLFGFFNTLT